MAVNIGRLNKRILIQAPVGKKDCMDQDRDTFEDHASVWATVKPYKSSDRDLAGKRSPAVTHKFYIRYRRDISPFMRIVYEGVAYRMVGAPVDMDERHELLEIQAEVIEGQVWSLTRKGSES